MILLIYFLFFLLRYVNKIFPSVCLCSFQYLNISSHMILTYPQIGCFLKHGFHNSCIAFFIFPLRFSSSFLRYIIHLSLDTTFTFLRQVSHIFSDIISNCPHLWSSLSSVLSSLFLIQGFNNSSTMAFRIPSILFLSFPGYGLHLT